MNAKDRIHAAPTPQAIEQGARIGANMVIVHSVGRCSHLAFNPDPALGRYMDEFPQYFDDYPKIAELRHSADSVWLEPLRSELRTLCDRSDHLGMKPAFHLYEPMLPLAFEREYPELVGVWKRTTQEGTIDVHTFMDPDNPATWELFKAKYRELARDFMKVGMFVITTGDTAGTFWCVADARMPTHERLANMVKAAREGVREAGSDARVCFRLWWRNFPDGFYSDGARMIGEATGLDNAVDLMNPVCKPHNNPSQVLPKLFELLPDDVPIMYKSTRMDIHDNTPLTLAAGAYPSEIEQIIEISYEMYHLKPWPWCKVRHIRQGLDAVREHNLTGYLSLPINMGNNSRDIDPESGNLGRMNTWMFEALANGDERSDRELLAAWLEREYGGPQPARRQGPAVGSRDLRAQSVQLAAHHEVDVVLRRVHPRGFPAPDGRPGRGVCRRAHSDEARGVRPGPRASRADQGGRSRDPSGAVPGTAGRLFDVRRRHHVHARLARLPAGPVRHREGRLPVGTQGPGTHVTVRGDVHPQPGPSQRDTGREVRLIPNQFPGRLSVVVGRMPVSAKPRVHSPVRGRCGSRAGKPGCPPRSRSYERRTGSISGPID